MLRNEISTNEIIEKAIEKVKTHSENMWNGSILNGTYNINSGLTANLKSGYMVATNNTKLVNKRPFLGVWFNDIELSFCIKSLKEALEIAIAFDQTAIYDLKKNREIYTKKHISVSEFSNYQKVKLRKKEGFSCIRNNKAFFMDALSLSLVLHKI